MEHLNKNKKIELLSTLAERELRIFRLSDIRKIAEDLDISPSYLSLVLNRLKKELWIVQLRRGLYCLSRGFLAQPIHEYEVAMFLAEETVISYWSAMHFHELTDQIPRKVYLSIPFNQNVPRTAFGKFGTQEILGISYVFSQVKQESFFGVTHTWINGSQIRITDFEKTLIDGLITPKYCGGFDEVFEAYKVAKQRINLDKLINYSLQMNVAVSKRLGWVLSKLDFPKSKLKKLQKIPIKGFRKLNVSGPNSGHYNSEWMIQENFYG